MATQKSRKDPLIMAHFGVEIGLEMDVESTSGYVRVSDVAHGTWIGAIQP